MLNRKGMTFVELLLVFTIIGLLATIALPRLKHVQERALIATMKRDLRTFAMHQESHYYDRASYTDDVATLRAGGFALSPDVSITVNEATVLGWSATAEHANTLSECYLFVGDASPLGAATIEGSLACS
jgi:prepilin-type N-terminal cleavage/methylation domain-containing protein